MVSLLPAVEDGGRVTGDTGLYLFSNPPSESIRFVG